MKTSLRIALTLVVLFISVTVAMARTPGSKVGVVFDRTEADFGTVAAGAPVHLQYVMSNNSSGAVAILSARASCGCTDPQYPRKPVMPGDSAVIRVTFNTVGQRGEIDKEVTLRLKNAANKSEKVQLVLRGVVVPE